MKKLNIMKNILLLIFIQSLLISCNDIKSKNTNEVELKYQNASLVSILEPSKKRVNSEFEFMSNNIISTSIKVLGSDPEEESRLARIIDNDLSIRGKYEIRTVQNFTGKDNSELLMLNMDARYKGFHYAFNFIGTEHENVYKINVESGKDFKVEMVK